jgi:hypothetical protein
MPALQGPELGLRLKALQAIWLRSGLIMTKAELLHSPPIEG